jgi:hypothetical protein
MIPQQEGHQMTGTPSQVAKAFKAAASPQGSA